MHPPSQLSVDNHNTGLSRPKQSIDSLFIFQVLNFPLLQKWGKYFPTWSTGQKFSVPSPWKTSLQDLKRCRCFRLGYQGLSLYAIVAYRRRGVSRCCVCYRAFVALRKGSWDFKMFGQGLNFTFISKIWKWYHFLWRGSAVNIHTTAITQNYLGVMTQPSCHPQKNCCLTGCHVNTITGKPARSCVQ